MIRIIFFILVFFLLSLKLCAYENRIIVASTTSTYDSGLLTYLNNFFKEEFNISVQVLSQGTGQALRIAKDGNVEVLIVHHKESEMEFMKNGYGKIRYDLMYNDYIIVGPKKDNKNCNTVQNKLIQIINDNLLFISRGDDSGTHKKELELWNLINLIPENFKPNYLNVGQGMGNTLLITNEKSAYTLTDRGTWISFNRKNNLKIICENIPPLFNQYGLILVNENINEKLNIKGASMYVNWLISNKGKELINSFKKNNQQLFFYNHH